MQWLPVLSAALALYVTMASAQSNPSYKLNADNLSLEQQIQVGDMLTKQAGAPLHGGAFPVSLNSKVPAQIELRPMPESAIAIAPELQGLTYVVVDEEIAIVEPQSRTIVAVLQRWRSPN
jgi:hypothetical protein